ncbi:MAG: shikimate dehydrogenase [Gammaproteobacteria bacterium]
MPARYAVFGNPIAHSLSPIIHQLFAKETNQDITYEKILVPLDGFQETVKEFHQNGGQGANVTLPFKEQAYEFANILDSHAKIAGSVNTLLWTEQNIIKGYNTDGLGLIRDLTQNQQFPLANKTILIIGAGGATKGVLTPILEQNPELLVIGNRTYDKAEILAEKWKPFGSCIACPFHALEQYHFDLIINATAASLKGEIPNIPKEIINHQVACYDMVYGQNLTPFLSFAKSCGSTKLMDGLGMLVEQAAESFYLWRQVKPNTQSVLATLRQS